MAPINRHSGKRKRIQNQYVKILESPAMRGPQNDKTNSS